MTEFRLIKKEELSRLKDLYESVKGKNYSIWDETYPTDKEIDKDYQLHRAYGLFDDQTLIGAITIEEEDDELATAAQFNENCAVELSRFCIGLDYQGQGYAKKIMALAEDVVRQKGYKALRLCVAPENKPALVCYQNMGYKILNETFIFGHDYYICEKILGE